MSLQVLFSCSRIACVRVSRVSFTNFNETGNEGRTSSLPTYASRDLEEETEIHETQRYQLINF